MDLRGLAMSYKVYRRHEDSCDCKTIRGGKGRLRPVPHQTSINAGTSIRSGLLCLRDPATALVGFSWDAADEKKARSSFGLGRKDFGLFYDAQKIAAQLGYSRFGLGRLCEAVLGLDLPKPKHVRASVLLLLDTSWEATLWYRSHAQVLCRPCMVLYSSECDKLYHVMCCHVSQLTLARMMPCYSAA